MGPIFEEFPGETTRQGASCPSKCKSQKSALYLFHSLNIEGFSIFKKRGRGREREGERERGREGERERERERERESEREREREKEREREGERESGCVCRIFISFSKYSRDFQF